MKSSESEGYEGCEASLPGIGERAVDGYEVILGMPVQKALEIWRSEDAPIIHLGPGENCERLDLLLSNPNARERHLQAVRAWLEKRTNKPVERGQ